MKVVYCHCAYAQVVPADVKQEVLRHLSESGASFDGVADLCEMAARKDAWLGELARGGPATIVACYPRAVTWLFSSAGAPLPAEGIRILNMRTESADEITTAIATLGEPA